MWSLSFGATNSSFNVLPLLKCTWMPNFLPMFLKLSLNPLLYGTVIEVLLVLLLVGLLVFLFCFGVFFKLKKNTQFGIQVHSQLQLVTFWHFWPYNNKNKKLKHYIMKKFFSSDTIKPRCLGGKNIFPYTRWSQISRIGKSLCLLKNIFCYRENQF